MTDAEFRAWLTRDNEHRVVLARMSYQYESGGAPATGILYFSNLPYIDEDGDPDPIAYLSAIKSTPQYSRSLSGERLGGYSSSVGALELDNADGALDYMLALPIDGSEITFLCGGIDWPIADFRSMFVALTVKIIAAAWDRITVTLRDTSLLLDKSVGGESSIDDGSPAVDNWRAANFGLLHQLECKLVDQSTLTYAHSDTGDGIAYSPDFEQTVRDRGYPILYTDNGDGTISLDVTPDGEITTDLLMVEGTNPPGYRAVSDAMQWLVGTRCGLTALGKYYGPDDTYDLRPNTDIGAWSLDGGQDYLIGISIQNKTNVEQLLNDLCDTGICFRAIRRDGMFTFGRIRPNDIASLGVASQATIREDDLDDNIRIEHATPTYYRLQAQMNTNWRIISNPATALLPEELAILTRDGLTQIQADAIGVTYADKPELYNLTLVQSPLIETLLSGDDEFYDAEYLVQWMEVRRSTFLPWMETVTVTVGLEYFELELGNVVTLEVPRFDFDAGELTQVIGIDINLMNAKITLRLMHRRLAAPPPEGWVREVEDADNIAGFSLQVPRPLIPIVELDLVFPGVVGGIGVGLLPIVTPYGSPPPPINPLSVAYVAPILGERVATLVPRTYVRMARDNADPDYLWYSEPGIDDGLGTAIGGNIIKLEMIGYTLVGGGVDLPGPAGTFDMTNDLGGATHDKGCVSRDPLDLNTYLDPFAPFSNESRTVIGVAMSANGFMYATFGGDGDITVWCQMGWGSWATAPQSVLFNVGSNVISGRWLSDGTQLFLNVDSGGGNTGVVCIIPDDTGTGFTGVSIDYSFGVSGAGTTGTHQDIWLSHDGLVLAVGVTLEISAGLYGQGSVVLFKRNDTTDDFALSFARIRPNLSVSGATGLFGSAICLSEDGNYMVVGEPFANGGIGKAWGIPNVLLLSGTTNLVTSVGYEFTHTYVAADAAYGISVACSSLADKVAIQTSSAEDTMDIWSL